MNSKAYKTLYKSIGMPEWRLIVGEGRMRFHPRLLTKAIFYPALGFDYACRLAQEWNAIDHLSEYTGLVIGFNVPPLFLEKYDKIMKSECEPRDLWITVEELYEMNQAIQGRISIYEVYYGEEYRGVKYTPQDFNEESFLA